VGCIHDFIKTCSAELARSNPEVKYSDPDYCCVIYPDDGYRETNIFVEYAQSVDRVGRDTETLKFKELSAVTVVSVMHRGGYESLRDAYLFAVNWARANGYVLHGEPRERYIHGAWDRQEESEWLTELQLPIFEGKE
jgi:effector-binding domain-containing protein